jgi:hypothetical protein
MDPSRFDQLTRLLGRAGGRSAVAFARVERNTKYRW